MYMDHFFKLIRLPTCDTKVSNSHNISCDSSDSRPKARLINRTTIIGLNKLSNELGPFK